MYPIGIPKVVNVKLARTFCSFSVPREVTKMLSLSKTGKKVIYEKKLKQAGTP